MGATWLRATKGRSNTRAYHRVKCIVKKFADCCLSSSSNSAYFWRCGDVSVRGMHGPGHATLERSQESD